MLFDCVENRRADIADGIDFGADGEVLGVQWIGLKENDPVLKTVCAEV